MSARLHVTDLRVQAAAPPSAPLVEDPQPRSRSSSDASLKATFALPEINAAIRKAIAKYDGAVFPKLNWSSPKVSTSRRATDCRMPLGFYLRLHQDRYTALHLPMCTFYSRAATLWLTIRIQSRCMSTLRIKGARIGRWNLFSKSGMI